MADQNYDRRQIINVIVDLLYWFSLSCFFSKWRRVNNTAFHAHRNTKLKYHNDNGYGNGKRQRLRQQQQQRKIQASQNSHPFDIFTRELKCTCRVSIYQFNCGSVRYYFYFLLFFSLSLLILLILCFFSLFFRFVSFVLDEKFHFKCIA